MIGNMKIKKSFGIAAGRLLLLLSYRPRTLRPICHKSRVQERFRECIEYVIRRKL